MEKEKNKMNNNLTMKDVFKGYSKYTDEEYKSIWKDAIIVVDTNILLNFYRFSNETRNEIYEVLNSQKKRLWIPYQVAYEYFKNKENVIVDANNDFEKLLDDVDKGFSEIINKVKEKPNKRLKCKEDLLKELEKYQEKTKEIILNDKVNNKNKENEECIEQSIFELFNNSVGPQISGEEFEKIKKEGKRRINESIPPGYKDKGKEENGDYYIFYSMVKYAKENQKHIIFMTDDVKEDWFIKRFGQIKSGDYRILNEFYKETGKLLLIYTSDGFIKEYQKNIKNSRKVDSKVIDELVSTRRENYDDEILLPPSIYIRRIKHIMRRLLNYDDLSIASNLRDVDKLRELLIKMDAFDSTINTMMIILVESIKRKNIDDINIILHELNERIFTNPIFNQRMKNDYNISDINLKKELLVKEETNIYEKASEMIDKIGKIKDVKMKSKIIDKMIIILDKANNKRYLSNTEILDLNIRMENLSEEIDKLLNENFV